MTGLAQVARHVWNDIKKRGGDRARNALQRLPLTMWKDPEAPHSVENLSKTTTLHLVRVELKK